MRLFVCYLGELRHALYVYADLPVLWQSWTRLLSASAGGSLRSAL